MSTNTVLKKGCAVGIILLFVGVSVFPSGNLGGFTCFGSAQGRETDVARLSLIEDPQDTCSLQQNGNNYSFHANTTRNDSSWFVVRFSSNKTISINSSLMICREPDSPLGDTSLWRSFWADPHWFIFTNLDDCWYSSGVVFEEPVQLGYYVQIGRFVKSTLRPHFPGACGTGFPIPYQLLPPGDYYIISINIPYKKGTIDVFLNLSSEGNVRFFTPTEGKSFQYENEDFQGPFIYKLFGFPIRPFDMKSIMIHGEKEITVDHTFIGQFFSMPISLWQRSRFIVTTPEQETYQASMRVRKYVEGT